MRVIEHKETIKLSDGTEQEVVRNEYVYSLRCGFCQAETGTLSFMEKEHPDVETNPERYAIADSRCAACEKANGAYQPDLAQAEAANAEL